MRIWGIAAVAALAISAFGVENVAPTKSELEQMYDKAFRAFDANDFSQALKELDAIDARQPDLAASKNLRGVILMRQGAYDKAEAALQDATRIDPKFWNARFNLAEIPFLKKDWPGARTRFEQLLSSSGSDLASEATQLIQYKILLTHLLEGKENMVDSILAKLELSPVTPAVDYVKAAVALQHKNEQEAKDWIAAAQKNFSPQLNKLFVESLYEVGWLQKPAGQARASLPIMTAAERAEKTKTAARSKFEQAQQTLRQRDFATARKLVDEADKAQPNQAATLNLRGEILMGQKEFDQAEISLKKAARLDPKLREAQYNLAQIPFKKKDYAKARERFEELLKQTPGGEKNQAAELIKFKIFMSLLLEGKESRAQTLMEQFQFTGDTPALYYAQAAWEYKHNNAEKAADWTASAQKIYSPSLNNVFADAFYDVGWMQAPEGVAASGPAFDTGSVVASQTEGGPGPGVEPSPIPDSVVAATKEAEGSKADSSAPAPTAATENASEPVVAEQSPSSGPTEAPVTAPSTQTAEAPAAPVAASEATSGAETAAAGVSPTETTIASATSAATNQQQPALNETKSVSAAVKSPVPKLAPIAISRPAVVTAISRKTWLVGALLLAGIFLLAWVIIPQLRRHTFGTPGYLQLRSVGESRASKADMTPGNGLRSGNGFPGGPRQISLRLTPSKPVLRRTVPPPSKSSDTFDRLISVEAKTPAAPVFSEAEPIAASPPMESLFESVGPVLEQHSAAPRQPEMVELPSVIAETTEPLTASADRVLAPGDGASPAFTSHAREPIWEESSRLTESLYESVGPVLEQTSMVQPPPEVAEVAETNGEASEPVREQPTDAVAATEEIVTPVPTVPQIQLEDEPVLEEQSVMLQEQSVPDEFSMTEAQAPVFEPASEPAFAVPSSISIEPVFSQTTTPVTMPETTQIPTVPEFRPSPSAAAKPQPTASTQTSVQLTFACEIAAMQLTPTFKMGVLKVRPASKLVTMRLAPSQQPQPMNLQVGFEIARIQPTGESLGTIRMVPSQQQRPTVGGSPSFAVAGLQVVPDSGAAPVQLTPTQQGQATVFVTIPFQITTLEFSPSLEIAAVILNSTSKQAIVQLPGASPGQGQSAPMFEITNLQVGGGGELAMMQLNLLGATRG